MADAHAASQAVARPADRATVAKRPRYSANVIASAFSSVVAYVSKRLSRSKNASSSPCVLLYGLPPTIASLEGKRRLRIGAPRRTIWRARAIMSFAELYDGPSHRTLAIPDSRSARLVV